MKDMCWKGEVGLVLRLSGDKFGDEREDCSMIDFLFIRVLCGFSG